jgi:hypothetical protein
MKPISIMAFVLGLAAAGVAGYHRVETYPNQRSAEDRRQQGDRASGRSRISDLDRQIWQDYRKTGWYQIYAMWGLGGLALLLGGLGAVKARKPVSFLGAGGAVMGLGALIVSFTTQMAGRIG